VNGPVVIYGLEVWTLSKSDENTTSVWERKMLRKIFGPRKENGVWRICTNQEFYESFREPDIITEIRKGR
jgi:hypothetical protein